MTPARAAASLRQATLLGESSCLAYRSRFQLGDALPQPGFPVSVKLFGPLPVGDVWWINAELIGMVLTGNLPVQHGSQILFKLLINFHARFRE